MHQEPEADGDVDTAIGKRQGLSIGDLERRGQSPFGGPCAGDVEHLPRRIDSGDVRASRSEGQGCAPRAGADVQHATALRRRDCAQEQILLNLQQILADRAPEAQRVESLQRPRD